MSVIKKEVVEQSATANTNTTTNTTNTTNTITKVIPSKKNVQVHLNKNLMNAFDKHIDMLAIQRSRILEVLIAKYLYEYKRNGEVATKKSDYQYLFDGKEK